MTHIHVLRFLTQALVNRRSHSSLSRQTGEYIFTSSLLRSAKKKKWFLFPSSVWMAKRERESEAGVSAGPPLSLPIAAAAVRIEQQFRPREGPGRRSFVGGTEVGLEAWDRALCVCVSGNHGNVSLLMPKATELISPLECGIPYIAVHLQALASEGNASDLSRCSKRCHCLQISQDSRTRENN